MWDPKRLEGERPAARPWQKSRRVVTRDGGAVEAQMRDEAAAARLVVMQAARRGKRWRKK